jgi:hypothetical protein
VREATMNLPGILYQLKIYLTSDTHDAFTVVTLISPAPFPEVKNPDLPALMKQFNSESVLKGLEKIGDWRLMTDAEVKECREDEDA